MQDWAIVCALLPAGVRKFRENASHSDRSEDGMADQGGRGHKGTVGDLDVHPVLNATAGRGPRGPVFPEGSRPLKGSLAMAVKIDEQAAEKAFEQFEIVYAPQTLSSKAILRNTWISISRAGATVQPLPPTVEKIHAATAVMGAVVFARHLAMLWRWDDIMSGQVSLRMISLRRRSRMRRGPR